MKKILLVIALASACGCTRPDHARQVLENSGYKNIEITGYRFFAGSKDDVFKTGFEATAPSGARVTGAVTEGLLFRGATIRLD